MSPGPAGAAQRGQALVEGMLALLGLAGLGAAVVWTAGLQDLSLQAGHASRHAVFDHARRQRGGAAEPSAPVSGQPADFTPFLHSWTTLSGLRLLSDPGSVGMAVSAGPHLSDAILPGGPAAAAMAREWRVAGGSVLHGRTRLPAVLPPWVDAAGGSLTDGWPSDGWPPRGSPPDGWPPRPSSGVLVADAYLLAGSGHAAHDGEVQQRLEGGARGWRDAATPSRKAAEQVVRAMTPVDAPWEREGADADWLRPWTGWVPPRHRSTPGGRP